MKIYVLGYHQLISSQKTESQPSTCNFIQEDAVEHYWWNYYVSNDTRSKIKLYRIVSDLQMLTYHFFCSVLLCFLCQPCFVTLLSKHGTKNNENGALDKIINKNNNLPQRWFLLWGINSLFWYEQSISWTYWEEILRIPTLVWKQSILIVSAVLIQRYRKKTYARLQVIPQK